MSPQRSTAWPLLWFYAGLIVYASLYPFEGWRVQGVSAWDFLLAPWPRYWTGFDLVSNVLGYAPLGFLGHVVVYRWLLGHSGHSGHSGHLRRVGAWTWAVLAAGAGLSLALESLQMLLPLRVPSNVDWGLNVLGTALGALCAHALIRLGALDGWSRWRVRWLEADASGALVLLLLWPVALMWPVAVPFGLGQLLPRLEPILLAALQDTPWLQWLPLQPLDLQPLQPTFKVLCIALGLMLPIGLANSVVKGLQARLWLGLVCIFLGMGANSLSAALSFGPAHAWGWIDEQVLLALLLALALAAVSLRLPRWLCLVLALMGALAQLTWLNQASGDVYLTQTLQQWEQGRFIRFHGLIQWLGWLWPYALLLHGLNRLSWPGSWPGTPKLQSSR